MGNQPVGHAVRDGVDVDGQHGRDLGWATNLLGNGHAKSCTQSALSLSLLLHLPLHQEFPLLRSLDDIDPLSFINGVWWTSLSAPILTARPTSYIVSSPL